MERKVGEVFEKDGKKYVTVLQTPENKGTCKGCVFKGECEYKETPSCMADCRQDGNDIIFIEVYDYVPKDDAPVTKRNTERKINEPFYIHGTRYKAVPQTPENKGTCKGCVFEGECEYDDNIVCTAEEDGNDIIYIEAPEYMDDKPIGADLYRRLDYLGIIPNDTRDHNVGASDYAQHIIQPWSIWLDYPDLTSWDHDIIKRVLRTKSTDSRIMDYKKIIHICEERIRQLKKEKQL